MADATAVQVTQLAGFGLDASQQELRTPRTARRCSPVEGCRGRKRPSRGKPRGVCVICRAASSRTRATDAVWAANREDERWFSRPSSAALMPIAFFSELPLSGQLNLMTIESFDRPGEIFSDHGPRSVAFVSVNTQAAGGAWSMQGAMTQGDLSSWIVAGSYKSIESANHAYELGLSYSTQRYDGGNAAALGAIRDSASNVGSVYGYDEWTISPRLVLGYGTGYARYDYLGGPGVWSPRFSITLPAHGLPRQGARVAQSAGARRRRIRAVGDRHVAAARAHVLVAGVRRPLHPRAGAPRADIARARSRRRASPFRCAASISASTISSIEIFDAVPGRAEAALGHYYVATAGDIDARGWGAAMTHEVPGYVRGSARVHGDRGGTGIRRRTCPWRGPSARCP